MYTFIYITLLVFKLRQKYFHKTLQNYEGATILKWDKKTKQNKSKNKKQKQTKNKNKKTKTKNKNITEITKKANRRLFMLRVLK